MVEGIGELIGQQLQLEVFSYFGNFHLLEISLHYVGDGPDSTLTRRGKILGPFSRK